MEVTTKHMFSNNIDKFVKTPGLVVFILTKRTKESQCVYAND